MGRRNVIHGIRKADIILIVGCLLAAVLIGIFFIVHKEAGSTVRILYDGMELTEIAIGASQAKSSEGAGDGYYLVTYRNDAADVEYFKDMPVFGLFDGTSYNLISVKGGTIVMEAADCADRICVRHKPITSARESIICLPHRLVVEIADNENMAMNVQDAIQGESRDDMTDETLDGVVR